MNPALAQVAASDSTQSYVIIGIVVVALATLSSLGVSVITFFRLTSGKANERQIEPTQLHAITAELHGQTAMLTGIQVKVGIAATSIEHLREALQVTKADHKHDIEGLHARVGGISRDLAATVARVDGLEKREDT